MCIYTAIFYRACGCMSFRLKESSTCAARPHNHVRALTVEFAQSEIHSQQNVQRRFEEAFNRPNRHLVGVARVFALDPAGRQAVTVADSNAQACRHAKLQLGGPTEKEGQCSRCLVVLRHPRPQEKSIMPFHGDKNVVGELLTEFGHFNSIQAKDLIKAGQKQETLMHQRRFRTTYQTIRAQRAALKAEAIRRHELEIKKRKGPQSMPSAALQDTSSPEPKPSASVKWDEWLTPEVIESWENEEKRPKATGQEEEETFESTPEITGAKRKATTAVGGDEIAKRVRTE